MRTKLQLSIPKPCSANWNEMTPNEQGKFCSLCNLTVVDFTKMNEHEIKDYFKNQTVGKTCGRFESNQLCEQRSALKQFWETQLVNVEKNIRRTSVKKTLLMALTLMAFITGCGNLSGHRQGEPVMGDTVAMPPVDTLVIDSLPPQPIMGAVAPHVK